MEHRYGELWAEDELLRMIFQTAEGLGWQNDLKDKPKIARASLYCAGLVFVEFDRGGVLTGYLMRRVL